MTLNETSNGDIDVPENFSAEEPQQDAEPLESAASSTSAGSQDDFDIDLGSYPASREDDVDINLDFGGAATEERLEDDFELDFGSLAPTEEPEIAEPELEHHRDARFCQFAKCPETLAKADRPIFLYFGRSRVHNVLGNFTIRIAFLCGISNRRQCGKTSRRLKRF